LESDPPISDIRAVLFDFGGVLAEEGFRAGLRTVAVRNGHDPERFFRSGTEAVYSSGYLIGKGTRAEFWKKLREAFPVAESDADLDRECYDRFILRPRMMKLVLDLRTRGIRVVILSDQTEMLEWLNDRDRFFSKFDKVYNSYRIGKSKRDASLFDDVVRELQVRPDQALFVDDSLDHVQRAKSRGLRALLFSDEKIFFDDLNRILCFQDRL
jgi:putative hydrolase of the HAD superfamily